MSNAVTMIAATTAPASFPALLTPFTIPKTRPFVAGAATRWIVPTETTSNTTIPAPTRPNSADADTRRPTAASAIVGPAVSTSANPTHRARSI